MPADSAVRELWLRRLHNVRKNLKLDSATRLCIIHFKDYQLENLPTIFPSKQAKKPTASAMKAEEEQCSSTGNQLQSSDAAPEDARCSPADISPERVSPNSQSPIGPPNCGSDVSVSLEKQSSDEYQGLTRIKSEDHPAETYSQDGFLSLDKTCHQPDRRPTDCCETQIQVKSEKVESDECYSDSGEPRKWVVCEGGLLEEVKMEHTDWSAETANDACENIDQKEQHNDGINMYVEPCISSVSTERVTEYGYHIGHESNTHSEQHYPCTSYKISLPHSGHKPGQPIHTKSYSCSSCGKAFKTSGHLKVHQTIHTGVKPYVCSTCGKSFSDPASHNRHEHVHTGVKPHTCATCEKSFTQLSHLKIHERIHRGLKPFSCSICEKSFTVSSSLSRHELIHTGAKLHVCATCGKSFLMSNSLKVHEKIHTGMKPYTCVACGKSFTMSSNLKVHEKIHMKPYTCATCGKSFTTSYYCKIHEKVHTDMRPYTCSVCGMSFTTSGSLKSHEKIHTDVKPYTCSICGKSFRTYSNCRIHEKVHTGVKPYSCCTCGKSFTTSTNCKNHEKIHKSVKPFTCLM